MAECVLAEQCWTGLGGLLQWLRLLCSVFVFGDTGPVTEGELCGSTGSLLCLLCAA